MYTFHATIHARPADATIGTEMALGSGVVTTLKVNPETLAATMLPLSFEEALGALSRFERMYCEPDGSFVWVSRQGQTPWQMDGNLYDRSERLLFVDIKGSCPRPQFDQLLAVLHWPATVLMFQLARQAVFLDEAEFRRFASATCNG